MWCHRSVAAPSRRELGHLSPEQPQRLILTTPLIVIELCIYIYIWHEILFIPVFVEHEAINPAHLPWDGRAAVRTTNGCCSRVDVHAWACSEAKVPAGLRRDKSKQREREEREGERDKRLRALGERDRERERETTGYEPLEIDASAGTTQWTMDSSRSPKSSCEQPARGTVSSTMHTSECARSLVNSK